MWRFIFPALPFIVSLTGALPAVHAAAAAWEALKFHKTPAPLAADAKTEDWPRFLGPHDAPVSRETQIRQDVPESGPPLIWECAKGSGYACPVVAGGKLVLFHRVKGKETLDCLDPETGKRFWSYAYPVEYTDDFGYSDGPRAAPVMTGGRVFSFGITSQLKCVDLTTGTVVWEVDCEKNTTFPNISSAPDPRPWCKMDSSS